MHQYIFLGLLKNKSMTGYEIKCMTDDIFTNFTQISYGIIYPTLAKLLKIGYVTMEESIVNGRYQKIYTLTKEGDNAFYEWLSSPIELVRGEQYEIIRIFFMGFLEDSKRKEVITDFIELLELEIKNLNRKFLVERNIEDRFRKHTVLYGISYYENLIKWCQVLL